MRRGRRGAGALVVGLLVVLLAACSDAHTEEEKAWADTGTGPDIVSLFVSPTFEATADQLVAAYEASDLTARVLVVPADPEHISETLADIDAPSVWIAPDGDFPGEDPDPDAVDLGAAPLVIAYRRDGRPAPPLESFATPGNGTGMCPIELPCGADGQQLLANAALTPAPDVETDATTLVFQVAGGTLEMALVHSTDAAAAWLRVVADNVASDDPALANRFLARSFGLPGRSADLLEWLDSSPDAQRVLSLGGLLLPPVDAPTGS